MTVQEAELKDLVGADPFFMSRREQIIARAARHSIATMYFTREYPAAGGLMSYGGNLTDTYRQAGIHAGRILKGEKPADLRIQQLTKVELVLNLTTAKALSITFPIFVARPRRRGDRVNRRRCSAARPLTARVQQRVARVGVLLNGAAAAPKD